MTITMAFRALRYLIREYQYVVSIYRHISIYALALYMLRISLDYWVETCLKKISSVCWIERSRCMIRLRRNFVMWECFDWRVS